MAGCELPLKNTVDSIRRETGRKDSHIHAFNRFLDRNMGRALNTTTVGGLLSIPSTNLEPRMDASAKVWTAPFGIRRPHPAHSHYSDLQLGDSSTDLKEVVTRHWKQMCDLSASFPILGKSAPNFRAKDSWT